MSVHENPFLTLMHLDGSDAFRLGKLKLTIDLRLDQITDL